MTKKSFHFLLWICLSVVFGVLGWLSFSIWNLESRRAEDLALTRQEETTRLALWRMDSLLATLWAEENSRPPQEYFYIMERGSELKSPLFQQSPDYARLYFQIDTEGKISSPQIQDPPSDTSTTPNTSDTTNSAGSPKEKSTLEDFQFLANSGITDLFPNKIKKNRDGRLCIVATPERKASTPFQKELSTTITNYFNQPKKEQDDDFSTPQQEAPPIPPKKDTASASIASKSIPGKKSQAAIDYDIRLNLNKVGNDDEQLKQAIQSSNSPFLEKKLPSKNLERSKKQPSKLLAGEIPSKKNPPSAKAKLRKASSLEKSKVKEEVAPPDASFKKEKIIIAEKEPEPLPAHYQPDAQLEEKSNSADLSLAEKSNSADRSLAEEIVQEPLPEKAGESSIAETSLAISSFSPRWIKGDLFLFRTVSNANQKYTQGIWIDWDEINKLLLPAITDLLPEARLFPLTGGEITEKNVTRVLAGLPVLIDPGAPSQSLMAKELSPLRLSLVAAWVFALAAAAGVAFLLIGIVRLSDRRATFVSAVTHELRTPLTTFNLYTEMLTEGLVPEKKLPSYFATLRQEARRLTHLVDNVLNFSRLEKSRPKRHPERITLLHLKTTLLRSLIPRLENAGLTLETNLLPQDEMFEISTDVTAVEQIMYNLADNSAKYAAEKGSTVHWSMEIKEKQLHLIFRDKGPGIPASLQKKLFRPFSRSAEEAAGKKPGVGLGLSLSREIARDLGGDLKWLPSATPGAVFLLILPLDS